MTRAPELSAVEPISNDGATTARLEAMETALLTLPRFTREVFLANRLDNLSYAEISRISGTSVNRVKREMARAIYGFARAMDGRPLRWWEWWW